MIRKKLLTLGEKIDSPEEAMRRLISDGHVQIAVQSLHTIPGEEFHKIIWCLQHLSREGIDSKAIFSVGAPLLSSYGDMERVADALIADAMPRRVADEAFVFMGHGSQAHPADLLYVALSSVLTRKNSQAFLGTVEGHPSINHVLESCIAARCASARLIPFMSIAGDHALNDMAGDGEESWKSILTSHGISCEPILKGTLENKQIRKIWLDHLSEAIECKSRCQKGIFS
jgi:sirohydrochlorin cobaltochelatase